MERRGTANLNDIRRVLRLGHGPVPGRLLHLPGHGDPARPRGDDDRRRPTGRCARSSRSAGRAPGRSCTATSCARRGSTTGSTTASSTWTTSRNDRLPLRRRGGGRRRRRALRRHPARRGRRRRLRARARRRVHAPGARHGRRARLCARAGGGAGAGAAGVRGGAGPITRTPCSAWTRSPRRSTGSPSASPAGPSRATRTSATLERNIAAADGARRGAALGARAGDDGPRRPAAARRRSASWACRGCATSTPRSAPPTSRRLGIEARAVELDIEEGRAEMQRARAGAPLRRPGVPGRLREPPRGRSCGRASGSGCPRSSGCAIRTAPGPTWRSGSGTRCSRSRRCRPRCPACACSRRCARRCWRPAAGSCSAPRSSARSATAHASRPCAPTRGGRDTSYGAGHVVLASGGFASGGHRARLRLADARERARAAAARRCLARASRASAADYFGDQPHEPGGGGGRRASSAPRGPRTCFVAGRRASGRRALARGLGRGHRDHERPPRRRARARRGGTGGRGMTDLVRVAARGGVAARLARPLRQVHDLRDRLPGLERHAAVPRAEVRRPAGRALPGARRAGGRVVGRLLLGLRDLHPGVPAGGEDRADQRPGPAQGQGGARASPLRDRLIGRPTLIGRLGQPAAPLANASLRSRPAAARCSRRCSASTATPRCRASRGHTFRSWAKRHQSPPAPRRAVYFHGCGTEYYEPDVGRMTVAVLEHNGFQVEIPKQDCCGLPLQSNGLFDDARSYVLQLAAQARAACPRRRASSSATPPAAR